MIRVGSSSVFSANLNSFHSTSPQTSGFYTNAASSAVSPSTVFQEVGFDFTVPPYPSTFKDKTICVYRIKPGEKPPLTVSDVYLQLTRVSGGFQVARFTGNSSVVKYELPADLSYGHGLVTNDITFLRVSSVMPNPINLTWLCSASGTSPRLIIGYQSDIIRTNGAFETSKPGGVLRITSLTYNGTDIAFEKLTVPFISITSLTLSNWTGSGLGGGTFTIWILSEGSI